ncbi:MAG TPA: Rieske 2Fe-2S domain-containing protein [Alphaproteobacteria bacterium]|nr:Rieske 2Fe-2S domain-containing protein [Alphaproteobacteria bacterium]
MLSREDNELLTRVGAGTPMGDLMRRYWIPAAFSDQVAKPDSPPIRVRLLGEDLVLFRDTQGRVGLVDEKCPHRTASLFFGRNEEGGLRCVYHGLKFDVDGNCTDLPCVPQLSDVERRNVAKKLAVNAYPCLERGDVIWTYMGAADKKPAFPELEWTMLPASQRFATRHIQECNWLQGFDGGFDSSHLSFLHSGAADLRKGNTDKDRRIPPSRYEVVPMDFGFACGGGRDLGNGMVSWHVDVMLMPFHKIIPSVPRAAHVWAPIDDNNTMLYSINFHPTRALTDEDLEREKAWRGIHTENIPGSDRAIANRDNDYLIDRALQAGGRSYTGMKGLGVQDCALQESMGPIADRSLERLLPSDLALAQIRRLLLKAVRDHMAGKPIPGLDPECYRVRSTRFEAPKDAPVADMIRQHLSLDTPVAAQ